MERVTYLIYSFRQLYKIAHGFCIAESSLQAFQLGLHLRILAFVVFQQGYIFSS